MICDGMAVLIPNSIGAGRGLNFMVEGMRIESISCLSARLVAGDLTGIAGSMIDSTRLLGDIALWTV